MLAGVVICVVMMLPLAGVIWHDERRRNARAGRPTLWMESAPARVDERPTTAGGGLS